MGLIKQVSQQLSLINITFPIDIYFVYILQRQIAHHVVTAEDDVAVALDVGGDGDATEHLGHGAVHFRAGDDLAGPVEDTPPPEPE